MEEIAGELTQDDLAPDDVMILDTRDQVTLQSSPWQNVLPSSLSPHLSCAPAGVCLDREGGSGGGEIGGGIDG